MKICVVSPDFPTSKTIDFVFVEQLCRALSMKGEEVFVIAPQSITKCIVRKIPFSRYVKNIDVLGKSNYVLCRPKYLTVGNVKGVLKDYNAESFDRAVNRCLSKMSFKPDVIYGHFWQSVRAAMPYVKKKNVPLFVASGEEHISLERIEYNASDVQNVHKYVTGAINVSTNNQEECIKANLINKSNSRVIPNSVDECLFVKKDKKQSRAILGIPNTAFVVVYVGQFTHRKGTLRLDKALSIIGNDNIKAIFIGRGNEDPSYSQIIKKGPVKHDDLPLFLSSADVFVLPTLHEGCCNAIIEALACGLPIISSNRPFNTDILNSTNSILVEPENINEIASAISALYKDINRRNQLSLGALASVKELTLSKRVEKIINFIKERINNDRQ